MKHSESYVKNLVVSALDDTHRTPKKIFQRAKELFPHPGDRSVLSGDEEYQQRILEQLVKDGRARTLNYDFFKRHKKIGYKTTKEDFQDQVMSHKGGPRCPVFLDH